MSALRKRVWAKIKSYFLRDEAEKQTRPLKSLRPAKNIDGHSSYVDDIARAVADDDIRNIALTGSYGSGKSSILRDFTDSTKNENNVIQISFSSLGANIQGYINQAGANEHDRLNNLTNLIQKEIVKQVLFREKYKNIPYSKYKRVSSPRLVLVFFNAMLVSVLLLALSFFNGWLAQLFETASVSDFWWQVALSVDLLITIAALVAIFILSVAGKIRVDKIGASSISLTLSGGTSYFDEYLDEVIYFFEARRYNVVIFEDIDRFDSLYIFETLRQLNTILNNSDQIKQPVTFIYAIKDSIFAKKVVDDKKVDHKKRSENRTKFFDLIIPVVPFITSVSSLDYMLEEFDQNYREIIKEPASVIARHITDMRLVINIYNEFLIFKDKVVVPDSGLKLDKLFAAVAYKNWNLEDFEKIKDGTSSIYKVIQAHSSYVDTRIQDINKEIRSKQDALSSINTTAERAQELGGKLEAYVTNVFKQIQGTPQAYGLNSQSYELADFTTEPFWENIIKAGDSNTLTITYRARQGYTQNLTLDTTDIQGICSDSLDKSLWDKDRTEGLKDEISRLSTELKRLPYMSIKELIDSSEDFKLVLTELDKKRIFQDKVGWDLINAGFIDTDFVNYTSLYHEASMSLKARNFMLNNIRLNKQSLHHKFEGDDDIQALLEKMGSAYLSDKSMYNISIVDYLLGKDDSGVDKIIANLAGGDADDLQFIDAYVKEGSEVTKFIQRLAAKWDGIFTYLAGDNEMDDKKKGHFTSLALVAGSENIKYKTSPSVKSFVEANKTNIQILANDNQDNSTVDDACRLLMQFEIEFDTLDNLNEPAKEAVKDYGLYAVNEQNMTSILGSPRVSLDTIKRTNEYVYSHLLGHLGEYVGLFQNRTDSEYALAGEDGFEAVIDEVSKISIDDLEIILANANLSSCIVQDINKLNMDTWPLLAKNVIMSNTLSNVLVYFEQSQASDAPTVDDSLAGYLNEAETVVLDKDYVEYTAENVKVFILAVLDSAKINVDTTVNIVHDCYKGGYIDASEIRSQNGTLYGKLLSKNCIEDSQANFESIRNLNWETKSSYIAHSQKFLEYIAALSLTTDELNSIAEDDSIPDAVNEYIVDNIVAYSAELSINSAAHFARFALEKSKVLNADALKVILDGADKETSIKLIGLSINNLDFSNMLTLMPVVGGEYKKLSEKNQRPSFENTDYNLNLITRLKELGLVSSYKLEDNETKIKVAMKSRW